MSWCLDHLLIRWVYMYSVPYVLRIVPACSVVLLTEVVVRSLTTSAFGLTDMFDGFGGGSLPQAVTVSFCASEPLNNDNNT